MAHDETKTNLIRSKQRYAFHINRKNLSKQQIVQKKNYLLHGLKGKPNPKFKTH